MWILYVFIFQVSEEQRQVGGKVPRAEWPEEVRPTAQFPASAQEQGELGDSGRGCEGNQEEHGVSPRQN